MYSAHGACLQQTVASENVSKERNAVKKKINGYLFNCCLENSVTYNCKCIWNFLSNDVINFDLHYIYISEDLTRCLSL